MGKNNIHILRISSIAAGDRGRCRNRNISWVNLKKGLSKPYVDTKHTMVQYQALDVDAKNKTKDCGSFVAGHFLNNIRKRENVTFRSAVALDIDTIDVDQMDALTIGYSKLCKYEFFGHTTRSHTLLKPKWRLLFPTKKVIPAEHYPAVSRILSSMLFGNIEESMDAVDDVSHRVAQIMYLPSVSKDGHFDTIDNEGELLDHEALLESWPNWQDWSALPHSEARGIKRPGQLKPAERPHEKDNFVGVFCRVYSVPKAIETFIPDVYVKPTKAGRTIRYTYAKGHGSLGAIVQDDGLFLYSHHGTDPCGERLVNAFDMVRLHLYGSLDAEKTDDVPATRTPSFRAMMEHARADPRVVQEMRRSQDERIDRQFADLDADEGEALDTSQPTSERSVLDEDEDDEDDDLIGTLSPRRPSDLARGQANIDAALALDDEDDILGLPHTVKHANGHTIDPVNGKIAKWVGAINERHAIVLYGSKARVAHLKNNGDIDFLEKQSFFDMERHVKTFKAGTNTEVSYRELWFEHEHAHRYDEVSFNPGRDDPKIFNLWRGWSVEPDPSKSCSLFLRHLKEVICRNDDARYKWLIRWLAHFTQKPWEKPGTIVVLKGRQGSGKDFVCEYLSTLCAKNFHSERVGRRGFGQFNSHLATTMLFNIQEANFIKSKDVNEDLKHMATSKFESFEKKGVDKLMLPSCYRIIMTSNEHLVVPADADSRRLFVTEVSDEHANDPAWFKPLYAEMEGDGPSGLLAYLQSYDLGDYSDLRFAPKTDELIEQKIGSLGPVEDFIYRMLSDGILPCADGFTDLDDQGASESWEHGPQEVWAKDLYEAYASNHRKERRDIAVDPSQFGKIIRNIFPSVTIKKARNGTGRHSQSARRQFWPSLETARAEMSLFLRADDAFNFD